MRLGLGKGCRDKSHRALVYVICVCQLNRHQVVPSLSSSLQHLSHFRTHCIATLVML